MTSTKAFSSSSETLFLDIKEKTPLSYLEGGVDENLINIADTHNKM